MKKKIQKPFNVEAAKNGAVIETKGGRPVRIVCYDRKDDYPIIALVDYGTVEDYNTYNIKGEYIHGWHNTEDLVIVEEVEETKFNVGDWVFLTDGKSYPWLITAITSNCYELQDTQGHKTELYQITVDNDKMYSLWTIKDAKPGDVLIDGFDHPFIFKGIYDSSPFAYCGIDVTDSIFISTGGVQTSAPVKPATYREKQQFFNRLEEEGYKWDARTFTMWKKCN